MTLQVWFAAALLLFLNLIAFAVQGLDKHFAKRGARRIPERRLLWFGAMLAAPGMWLGMRTFRHKTRKSSFLAYAWMVTVLNLALAYGLFELWRADWLTFRS